MSKKFIQRICKINAPDFYTCLSEENPLFMWEFFEKRDMKYEQRTESYCKHHTNTIGANSLISRDAHLWHTLPDDIEMLTQLQ